MCDMKAEGDILRVEGNRQAGRRAGEEGAVWEEPEKLSMKMPQGNITLFGNYKPKLASLRR